MNHTTNNHPATMQSFNCAKSRSATLAFIHSMEQNPNNLGFLLQENWNDIGGPPPTKKYICLTPPHTNPRCATYLSTKYFTNIRIITHYQDHILSVAATINNTEIEILNYYSPTAKDGIQFITQHQPLSNLYLAGDFNIHHPWWYGDQTAKYDSSIRTSARFAIPLVDWAIQHGLQLANTPGVFTHFPRNQNRPSILDLTFYRFTNNSPIHNWTAPNDGLGSDHGVTFTTWNISPPRPSTPKPNYRKLNLDKARPDLRKLNPQEFQWETPEETLRSTNTIWAHTLNVIRQHTPPTKQHHHTTIRWWTPEMNKAKKRISYHHKIHQQLRTDITRMQLKKARKEFKSLIYHESIRHTTTTIQNTTPSTVWKIINPRKGNPPDIPTILGATTFTDKAKMFNDMLFPPAPANTTEITPEYTPRPKTNLQTNFEAVTDEEISRMFHNLSNTAPGPDTLPYSIINIIHQCNPTILTTIYSNLLWHGVHPTNWKQTKIILIPKPGKEDYSSPKGYRPISLSNTVSKILEKIVAQRLQKAGELNGGISTNHLGCITGDSPSDALFQIITPAFKAIQGKITTSRKLMRPTLLTTDIDGAFNCVTPSALQTIMENQKFPTYLTKWTKDFTTNRATIWSFNGKQTDPMQFNAGLPQGSPTSPVLFIIYASASEPRNDNLNESTTYYVDDANMLQKAYTQQTATAKLQARLNKTITKGQTINIKYSAPKTEIMHIEPPSASMLQTSQIPITIDNQQRYPTAQIKSLGVIIDNKLTFRIHAHASQTKLNAAAAALYRLAKRTGLSPLNLHTLTHQGIIPQALWASEIWWSGATHITDTLAPTYNNLARTISGCRPLTKLTTLHHISGCPPLNLLLDYMSQRAAIRILRNPNNQVHDQLVKELSKSQPSVCLGAQRLAYLTQQLIGPLYPLEDLQTATITPCTVTIADLPKEAEKLNHLNWVKNMPNDTILIYTDGSKNTQNQVSSAWAIYQTPNEKPIHTGHCSIGSQAEVEDSELHAIQEALTLCLDLDTPTTIHVLVDNQNALRSITGAPTTARTYLKYTTNTIKALQDQNHTVTLQWTPTHTGILGNETADKLTHKETHTQRCQYAITTLRWLNTQASQQLTKKWNRPCPPQSNKPLKLTRNLKWSQARQIHYMMASTTTKDTPHRQPQIICECGKPDGAKHQATECKLTNTEPLGKPTSWEEIFTKTKPEHILEYIYTNKLHSPKHR